MIFFFSTVRKPRFIDVFIATNVFFIITFLFLRLFSVKCPNGSIIAGTWSDGIQGFALNGKLKQIFVKNDHLDSLILVIGHEIGHIHTKRLSNSHDEEAKAFSFAIEWAKTIKKHNLGNLSENIKDDIDFKPARNGLHDLAFFFVKNLMNKGLKPMDIHRDLVKGYKSLFALYD